MTEQYLFDVFLSHSSADSVVVEEIAGRLRAAGLRVWFDGWMIRPGDSIPWVIEQGLQNSRVLVLCISTEALASDWATLESGTFRFIDPLNKQRRFIPLCLDDARPQGSIAQFLHISWRSADRVREFPKLLEACRPPTGPVADRRPGGLTDPPVSTEGAAYCRQVLRGHTAEVYAVALAPDGSFVVSGSNDGTIRVWDTATGGSRDELTGHEGAVRDVVIDSHDRLYSAGDDGTIRAWDLASGRELNRFVGHPDSVHALALTPDETSLISGAKDGTMLVWRLDDATVEAVLRYEKGWINAIVVTPTGEVIGGAEDGVISRWQPGRSPGYTRLDEHVLWVWGLAITPDGTTLVSGSGDSTVGVWDLTHGRRIAFLEGHADKVSKVGVTADGRFAVSGSLDRTAKIWRLDTGTIAASLEGHAGSVECVAISPDGRTVVTGSSDGDLRLWAFSPEGGRSEAGRASRYTNAKVLLVGDSGAGKTGLSRRLALGEWSPSDSTIGAWVTPWRLPTTFDGDIEGEIWLWDFGGQADQRLIHQLYMDDTALAVLVFDGQQDALLETLRRWDRDLARSSRGTFAKILVAGRVDAGGLRVSRAEIEEFRAAHGYLDFIETSAKDDINCAKLRQAILSGITWADIPWRSSPVLFRRLKEEILRLKDAGRVLMRFNELREALQLRMSDRHAQFTDNELAAVLHLLSGPGIVWELEFGSWILLQPERVNEYAQAVIRTMRADQGESGSLAEERVLAGDLQYTGTGGRLSPDEERFVLLAMHKILLERGLCLREHTETGTMLIFPSYFRRPRPLALEYPAELVSYRFTGFLDEIYATLVVRLHYTSVFAQDTLWHYAADFRTLTGKRFCVTVQPRAHGAGELVVYADPAIDDSEKIIFSRYVHEHLLGKGQDIERMRHYVCRACGTPVGNREIAMRRLGEWQARSGTPRSSPPTIVCAECEERVPLWDAFEEYFASAEAAVRVRQLRANSDDVLDDERKDRALVGEVMSTASLAGQLIQEQSADQTGGVDLQIEFCDDHRRPTGRRILLQLWPARSAALRRHEDGSTVLTVDRRRVAEWADQQCPVFLVTADDEGRAHWMEVSSAVPRAPGGSTSEIVFAGERFDVMSVRRWRDRLLTGAPP